MIISVSNHADRIRLIAIEPMKGAFGNEGALPLIAMQDRLWPIMASVGKYDKSSGFFASQPLRLTQYRSGAFLLVE